MMKKIPIFIICLVLLLISAPTKATTNGADYINGFYFKQDSFDHDYFLEYVLFGKKLNKSDDPSYWDRNAKMTSLNKIEYASYLCVDQYNNGSDTKHEQDQDKLNRLRQYIGGIPGNIDDINPKESDMPNRLSPTNHRTYTHQGWEYPYGLAGVPKDVANARVREKILLRTIDNVFDFHTSDDGLFEKAIDGIGGKPLNDNRCRSYAKLIYYIHLLGDCYEDNNYFKANGSNNGQKLPLGRANPGKSIESSDLITEIINVCEELFSMNETNAERYAVLKSQLMNEKRAIKSLYSLAGGVYSEERYQMYHERVCALMGVLMDNLPKLLRNEDDFVKAFSDINY